MYDEEYLHVEYGESLEVKRSLQTTIAKDMVCNAIVDNKSCENFASNYIAEKLKSQPSNRQDPYKLQWLNKDNEKIYGVMLFRWKFPTFTMPCQYDHRALYDGYANTCTFLKDVIEINLAPLPLNEFNDGKKEFKQLGLSLAKEPFKKKTKLYISRLDPKPPWEDVTINFSLGLLWTRKLKDSKMVVEDKSSKMAHFIIW
ncbi:hypothetical protein MTR_0050s0090 [Medicago truncatula]|uniref:Uncharacterized protein n=1 Tax=Medicago truncatula TaxID=3880 RepID=A0A072TU07_MEDTR|nr:hypothetical protein MTR_0050s0090 [Medicago truncatula]